MRGNVLLDELADGGGVEPALDLLDALVQRVFGVAGQDGDGLLRQDRPVVDLFGGDVDGRAGDLDPERQRVAHRVPALERGQQRRVGVQHPTRERGRQRRDHRAEPGHGHEIDAVGLQDLDELLPVGGAVEAGSPLGALDELAGDGVLGGDVERPAGPVGDDHRDREPLPQHGVQ